MYPYPIINLPGPLGEVHLYGLMIAIGIMCAFFVIYFFGKIRGISIATLDFIFYAAIASIAIGFVTSALWQGIYDYIENPELGFHPFSSGITFIGGLIGGVICFVSAYFIFRKKLKITILDILPLAPCAVTIGHSFGRLGCFFAGCCYGKQTHSWLGVAFPNLPYDSGYYKRYPTNLFESIFLLVLFIVLAYLYIKIKFRHNMSVYLIAYGCFRFFIEYLRDDDRGQLFKFIPLSPSQIWSIAMIIIGVVLIITLKPYFEKLEKERAQKKEISTQDNN